MKQRGIGFLFLLTITVAVLVTLTVVITVSVAKRMRLGNGRYYLHTQTMPDGTITSLFDSKTNTELLYIAELSLDPPSITVLPVSRLDIENVSVGPFGKNEVTVWYKEEDDRNLHAIMVNEPSATFSSTFVNTDTDKDGATDVRTIGFPTDVGRIAYTDLDANGTLDAQYTVNMEDDPPTSSPRILVKSCWVAVADGTHFDVPPLSAKTLDTPPVTYHFKGGTWQAE